MTLRRALALVLVTTAIATSCVGFTLGSPPDEGASSGATTTKAQRTGENQDGGTATTSSDDRGDPATAGKGTAGGTFEKDGCAFDEPEGYDVECGWLVVPEDRDTADSDTIRLHVGVFHRRGATVAEDPIIYLEGGPGGNALEGSTIDFDGRFGEYTDRRDVIVFDQRGTGFSEPALVCEDLDRLFLAQLDDTSPVSNQLKAQQEALATCAEGLRADGVDLAQYNSVESAADVADLRLALGYEEINLLGVSYGTRLAQTMMREHPEGIRSVILDSTLPIAADLLSELPGNTKAAFDHFFTACAADPGCNERYPNLADRFWAQVKALDAKPVKATVRDFLNNDEFQAAFNGTDLVDLTFQALYDESLFVTLPGTIEKLEKGDASGLATLGSVSVTNAPFITLGMHISVKCNEDVAFADPAEVTAAEKSQPEFAASFQGQIVDGTAGFATCDLWKAGKAPAVEDQPVTSDLPTLVLSGGFDPITPERWAREVTKTLPKSQLVTFPTVGHGIGLSGGCGAEVINGFLSQPTAKVDAGCVTAMPPVRWVPRVEAITLEPFTADILGTSVSGVKPKGWVEQAPGAYGRGQNGADQTAILVQAVRKLDPQAFVDQAFVVLPLEGKPQKLADVTAGGNTWSRYRATLKASAGGGEADFAVTRDGDIALFVMLVSQTEDREALLRTVFEPALENTKAT